MLKIKAKDFSQEIQEDFMNDFFMNFNPEWPDYLVDDDDQLLPWNGNPERVFYFDDLENEAHNFFWECYDFIEKRYQQIKVI